MIRFILILLASILAISLLRAVIGVVTKAAADFLGGGGVEKTPRRQDVPLAGELKRDPVCGTYVSTATSVKKTVGGQVIHFCSAECRDKHKG